MTMILSGNRTTRIIDSGHLFQASLDLPLAKVEPGFMRQFIISIVKGIYRGIRPLGIVDTTYLMHLADRESQLDPNACRYDLKILEPEELRTLGDESAAPSQIGRFTNPDRQTLVVALDEGRIVSFIWITCNYVEAQDNFSRTAHLGTSIEMPLGTGFLYNAWTDPEYRGQRLVGTLAAFAVGDGGASVRALLTSIDWTNQPSIRAFEKLGMRPVGLVTRIGWGAIQLSLTPRNASQLGIQVAEEAPGPKIAF